MGWLLSVFLSFWNLKSIRSLVHTIVMNQKGWYPQWQIERDLDAEEKDKFQQWQLNIL
jgi:hypothetical protein